jgi:hypothetical protein
MVDRTRTPRKALELKFKERDIWDNPDLGGLVWHWKTSRKEERAEMKDVGQIKETEDFLSIGL